MCECRQEALRNFPHIDEETTQVNDSNPVTPIQLEQSSAIIAIGYVPSYAKSFAINLTCKSTGNIALHFNPRLDRGYVVRNSKVKGSWEKEEACSPNVLVGAILQRKTYFHLIIFCGPKEFQISLNGEHFCTFTYRLPLELISNFEYNGDIEDIRIRTTTLYIYPDPKIIKTIRNLELSNQEPLLDNLNVPVSVHLVENSKPGATFFIRGRLKLLPHSFIINFQQSQLIHPHPEIALHLNPRFLYGNQPACVVMNCWTEGSWGQEERHEGHLTLSPGREFLLTIRCENNGYVIWLGNKMIAEFKHRLEPSIVDTLQITGDVVLHQLSLTFES